MSTNRCPELKNSETRRSSIETALEAVLPQLRKDAMALCPREADEVVSDVLYEVVRLELVTDEVRNLRAFCRGIARNIIRRRARSAAARRETSFEEVGMEHVGVVPAKGYEELEADLSEFGLLDRFEALDEEDQSTLRLTVWDGAKREVGSSTVDPKSGQQDWLFTDRKEYARSVQRARRHAEVFQTLDLGRIRDSSDVAQWEPPADRRQLRGPDELVWA